MSGQFVRRVFTTVSVIALLCALTGCNSVPVSEDLNQSQANEIVATLIENGISASSKHETGSRGKYSVEVKRQNYSEAMSLLFERGLPSEQRPSFNELVASRGLMPDSRDIEALRFDRALAAEIEEAIQSNPAVASVRVIVRRNALNLDFSAETNQPAVSASITIRPGTAINQDEIKELISRALPGVTQERTYVLIHEAVPPTRTTGVEGVEYQGKGRVARIPLTDFLWIWKVPEDDYNSLAIGLLTGILVVFSLGSIIGSSLSMYRNQNKNDAAGTSSATRRTIGTRNEKQKRELIE